MQVRILPGSLERIDQRPTKEQIVKVEVGKRYWARCGLVVKITGIDSSNTAFPFNGESIISDDDWWTEAGNYDLGRPHPLDLVCEFTPEDEIREQTIDTFAKIMRNGCDVPDGMRLEYLGVTTGKWHWAFDSSRLKFGSHYRLTPFDPPAPPRFTMSANPVGILDAKRPGMIAESPKQTPMGGTKLTAAKLICEKLNSGKCSDVDLRWTPIKPEMVPLELSDITPGSVFRIDGDTYVRPHGLITDESVEIRTGGSYVTYTYGELRDKKVQILRPGQTWQLCQKPKPSH